MSFTSLTALGHIHLSRKENFKHNKNRHIKMLLERFKAFDLHLVVISTAEPERLLVERSGLNWDVISCLHQAWTTTCDPEHQGKPAYEHSQRVIEELTLPLINPTHEKNFLLRKLRSDWQNNRALLFLEEDSIFPWTSLIMLTYVHQVIQDRIPLHASAVVFQDELYLFGGPSGAGKSSAAQIIVAQGGQLLDEDQVILRKNQNGSYSADAWGYSLRSCTAPIRAIFQLEHDQIDAMEQLTLRQAVVFLLQQAEQVAGWMLPDGTYQQLFRNTAELARHIPVYRMHFKLSSGFWSLIQKELHRMPS